MDLRSFPGTYRFKLSEALSRRPLFVPSLNMKQKAVINVQMKCRKCRVKAIKTAAKYGASSMAIEGSDDNQLVLIGEGVDWVGLTCSLRTKHRSAYIASVQEVKEKNKDPEGTPNPGHGSSGCCSQSMPLPCYPLYPPFPYDCQVVVYDSYGPPSICSIM